MPHPDAAKEDRALNDSPPPPVLDLFRLNGRTAIVTGAARGLGKALAIAWPRRAPTSSPSTSATSPTSPSRSAHAESAARLAPPI